ncbi:response regulator receiver domain [Sphingobacterium siyangense]|uniref:response regulator receiver domain n=1 Tax=Sphingobacterium siyangense TaxID=459529 RepID=UPI003DA5EF98
MYNKKAFEILNSSITNAIFIDEKAKEFYSETPLNSDVAEEKLSLDLFNAFKKNGKNLTVHRFEKSNLDDPNLIDYLFKGKDLILLDWELAGLSGQEYSLELLQRAIGAPYINFCCIYSSSANFNEIPLFLDAFFSGLSEENFESIKNQYEHFEVNDLRDGVNLDDETVVKFIKENDIDLDAFPIEYLKGKSKVFLLRLIHVALNRSKFFLPKHSEVKYEILNTGDNSFMINNTFVLTLKKDFGEDSDIGSLLKRISEIITKNKGSFFQLLGLEMQSVFNSNERFIDETILKSSTEALFKLRNHINNDRTFGTIVKKLLIEQATLKLRTAKLGLLESVFLDSKSEELKSREPTQEDLFQLNVFYNSVTVRGLHPDNIPNLNFGDVFKGEGKEYYLCITALCDCYFPDKIQSNFYFAKGTEFDNLGLALTLGDTAFLSFLPNGKVVLWGDAEMVKKIKIKKSEDETDEQFELRKELEYLRFEADAYKKFLYKPFFIKPKVYNVENNKLINNKMRIWDITNKYKEDKINQNLNYFDVEYITTLRDDYTQRISNHAFGHPARVGVDFVKV